MLLDNKNVHKNGSNTLTRDILDYLQEFDSIYLEYISKIFDMNELVSTFISLSD